MAAQRALAKASDAIGQETRALARACKGFEGLPLVPLSLSLSKAHRAKVRLLPKCRGFGRLSLNSPEESFLDRF
jgi:hypothetical protein